MSAQRIALAKSLSARSQNSTGSPSSIALRLGCRAKYFVFLKTDTDLEIRFLSNRGGDGEDESFNAAVCALARTNEK